MLAYSAVQIEASCVSIVAFSPPSPIEWLLRLTVWTSAAVFQNHVGHREARGMRDRKGGVSDTQLRRDLCSAAVKAEVGATAGFPHHFDLQPVHAPADPGSQGLCGGFLGGKSSGE